MTRLADEDGVPLRRTPDGDLVPDHDIDAIRQQRLADAKRRIREAIQTARQENE